MKKMYLTIAAIAILSLTGCSKHDVVGAQEVKGASESKEESNLDINKKVKDKMAELDLDSKSKKIDEAKETSDEVSKKTAGSSEKLTKVNEKLDLAGSVEGKIAQKIKAFNKDAQDATDSINNVRSKANEAAKKAEQDKQKLDEAKNEINGSLDNIKNKIDDIKQSDIIKNLPKK